MRFRRVYKTHNLSRYKDNLCGQPSSIGLGGQSTLTSRKHVRLSTHTGETHMKTQRAAAPRAGLALAFGAAGALLTLMPVGAGAQQPPAQDPGQAAQGQPGGGRRQRGFGQGGFGQGQMPFAQGTVSGGDPATGTIIINSQFGGGTQTIHVPNGTKGVALVQIDASKLAVGDTIQVQGVPKEITASTITAGEVPDFLRVQRGGPGGPGGAGGPGAAPGAAPAGGGGQPGQPGQPARPQAFANASGKVTKVEPLTIS